MVIFRDLLAASVVVAALADHKDDAGERGAATAFDGVAAHAASHLISLCWCPRGWHLPKHTRCPGSQTTRRSRRRERARGANNASGRD